MTSMFLTCKRSFTSSIADLRALDSGSLNALSPLYNWEQGFELVPSPDVAEKKKRKTNCMMADSL